MIVNEKRLLVTMLILHHHFTKWNYVWYPFFLWFIHYLFLSKICYSIYCSIYPSIYLTIYLFIYLLILKLPYTLLDLKHHKFQLSFLVIGFVIHVLRYPSNNFLKHLEYTWPSFRKTRWYNNKNNAVSLEGQTWDPVFWIYKEQIPVFSKQ